MSNTFSQVCDPDQSATQRRTNSSGMDCRANSDVMFLPDEKFDFNVSLSPASSKGDEDEVFVDQVSHMERCVAVNMASRLKDGGDGMRVSWSPLTGDQLEAMCEEAHRLANLLQSSKPSQPHGVDDEIANMTSDATTDREQFVQDTEAELGVIGQPANSLSPVKCQTSCVQESPMKHLRHVKQHQRGVCTPPATNTAESTRPATNAASSTRPATNAAASNRPVTNTAASNRPATNAASFTRPATKAAASTRPATTKAAASNAAASTRSISNAASSICPATTAASSTPSATKAAASNRPVTNAAASNSPATNAASSTRPATKAAASTRPATKAAASNAAASTRPISNAASSICPATTAASSTPSATNAAASNSPATKAAASTRPATKAAASTHPATKAAASTHPATNAAASTRPASTTRLSTSSPVVMVKAKPRTALKGNTAQGVGVVLPSKPAAPSTSCSANKNRVEKNRLQPPSKVAAGWRRSPNSCSSSRAESYEDLLSDSTSVASDISDSSLNSSLLGKRTLAPPTKSVRNPSGVKAPPLQRRRVTERKNTSSSSSSVSSFNSSLSLSPATGKPNSSTSLSSYTVPAPSSISKPANQNRQHRSNVCAAAEAVSSTTGRRSLSTQARKLSTPLKRTEATPLQPTSSKRVLERTASIPATASARLQSGLKAKPKPQTLAPPTTSAIVRGVRHGDGISSPDVSKMLMPKRLMSASSVDSVPQKPSAGGCRSLQVKACRPSALPTPLRSKMSAIPTTTPNNQTQPARLPTTSDPDHSDSTSARRASSCSTWLFLCSPTPPDTQGAEPVDALDIQPFCLEEEEPPAAPPSTSPQPDHSESMDTGVLSQGESEPGRNLIELKTTEESESNSKTQEVLLFDLPAPTLQPQEKLLIDLTSTPNLIRTSNKTCTTTQLIDLSSPLIKWSPEDKKENNAPLINLSF
ncbi:mucin-5AC-like isoform X2 [Thunnus maccoyii]|uniref:mucin-5AC-like isoform X2 n=1 Tax=Thunnus maccoyii TaxID=8240 RepID=UPI001C4BC469|nr:mucin-5AC-like isoform X2 [Thunnus maccoyii]